MRAFKTFTIRQNFITGIELQWSLNQGFNATAPYNFTVQASSTIDFSEIIYNINVGDNYFALDDSNIKQNWSKDLYYRVKLVSGDPSSNANNTYYSETLSFDYTPAEKRKYRMAADILRKFNVLAKFTGKPGWLLKRKVYGAVDIKNVDQITGIPLTNNVGGFGVGIIGGYYNPVAIAFVTVDNTKDKALSQDNNVKEMETLVARVNGFPYVDVFDIIVNARNSKRYQIDSMKPTFFPGTEICIGQKLQLNLLPMGDTVYQIEVPTVHPLLPLSQQPGV